MRRSIEASQQHQQRRTNTATITHSSSSSSCSPPLNTSSSNINSSLSSSSSSGLGGRCQSCVQLNRIEEDYQPQPTIIESDVHHQYPHHHHHHYDDDDDDLEVSNLYLGGTNNNNATNGNNRYEERLLLPRKGSMAKLDEYLSRIPRVVSRAGEVLAMDHEITTDCNQNQNEQQPSSSSLLFSSSRRCLNVLQGEMAHVSAHQADVVVSAEATTCHVVALRSTKSASVPLVSLAHVDQVYDACLENMVKEHIEHHHHAEEEEYTKKTQGDAGNEDDDEDEDDFGFFMEDDDDDVDDQAGNNKLEEEVTSQHSQSYLPDLVGCSSDRRRKSTSMPDLHVIPPSASDTEPIEMELHMVGGYLDKDGTSQQLSTALIERFNDLAYKYRNKLKISLSTAAISCLNNDTHHGADTTPTTPSTTTSSSSNTAATTTNQQEATTTTTATPSQPQHRPRCRGLAIDTHTGQVFPVKRALPAHLEGPALEIRQARAFADSNAATANAPSSSSSSSSSPASSSLAVIHDKMCIDGEIRIQPFQYERRDELDILLKVPDDVLLSVTSTSPDQESDQFCTNFRRTLSFVNTVPPEQVFGTMDNPRPLVYTRSSDNLNAWEVKKYNNNNNNNPHELEDTNNDNNNNNILSRSYNSGDGMRRRLRPTTQQQQQQQQKDTLMSY